MVIKLVVIQRGENRFNALNLFSPVCQSHPDVILIHLGDVN